jgi:hypothetical protein
MVNSMGSFFSEMIILQSGGYRITTRFSNFPGQSSVVKKVDQEIP